MHFEPLEEWVWHKMKTEWPENLTYHSVLHIQDVYESALRYAKEEQVSGESLTLLLTGVLLHDFGFINTTVNHEVNSCKWAREVLPEFDYTDAQIEMICQMIMATKLPQSPRSLLDEILCDADLDYLGRDDYFEISDRLYQEFQNLNIVSNELAWMDIQIRFLESHAYHRPTARAWREENKQKVLYLVKANRKALLGID